jgi:hypothetical protein
MKKWHKRHGWEIHFFTSDGKIYFVRDIGKIWPVRSIFVTRQG